MFLLAITHIPNLLSLMHSAILGVMLKNENILGDMRWITPVYSYDYYIPTTTTTTSQTLDVCHGTEGGRTRSQAT